MRIVGPVGLAVAVVLVGCGSDDNSDENEASSDADAPSDPDAFCDGAETLAGLEDQLSTDLDEGFDGLTEEEHDDPVAEVGRQEDLLPDLVASYGDFEADVEDALETMLSGVDDDEHRTALEWQLGYQRIVFEVVAGVGSTDDLQAAWDEVETLASQQLDGRPHPLVVRELGDLCGIQVRTQPFGRRLLDSASLRPPEEEHRQLPDVDVCSLLPTDAATVLELEGVPGAGAQEGACRWGDESASGFEVELFLVDPPFPLVFLDGWDPYSASPDFEVFRGPLEVPTACEALVDAEGYFVVLSMEGPFEGVNTACDFTPLVAVQITRRLN